MRNAARFQAGSQIVEVIDDRESETVLMTVSKASWHTDHVQFVLPRHVTVALGHMLVGEPTSG